jgi:PAS domain S-box-containing protein
MTLEMQMGYIGKNESKAPPYPTVTSKHEKLSAELTLILAQLPVQQTTPLLVTDLKARILYANPVYERMSGRRQSQLLGRDARDFFSRTGDPSLWTQLFSSAVSGQALASPMEIVRADEGTERYCVELSPVHIEDNQVKYIALRLLPYHEEAEASQSLHQAQKMQAIGTLAAGIAHDFNNILYTILGNTELALAEATKDSDLAESLEEILVASKRAAELVSHILTFSTPSEHERRTLDLAPLVKGVSKFLRSSLPSTIEIQYSVSPCGTVFADPSQLHQMLVNLGTNALHAMQGTGGTLEIQVAQVELDATACAAIPPLQPGPHAEILVKDNGCGMDPLTLERAFEPYFSTKERHTGVGLGLAVVYGIVQNHAGSVEIESAPGQGTAVRVLLPLAAPKGEPIRVPKESHAAGHKTLRVLFVDDEPAIARMGRRVLERLGHSVLAFESALAALEALTCDPGAFDVMVTDQTMPDMTGIELSRRCLELRPDLPIVLSTGFSEGIDENSVREHGIREFVMKPIVSKDLEIAIYRAVGLGDPGA